MMRPSSIASLMVIMAMILDTGQGQDNCREISDGCSCPRPNHLRCIGRRKDLPRILDNMKGFNITLLDLSLQDLDHVSQNMFENQTFLSVLVISSSGLKSIERGAFTALKNLTALSLSNNLLETIPEEVIELKHLNRLDLSQNRLKSINANIVKLEQLEVLDVSDNDIHDLVNVEFPSEMRKLVLKNNHLTMKTIQDFDFQVRELDLSYNELNGSFGMTSLQTSLRTLDLSFNTLINLNDHGFANFPVLRNLNLRANKIELIRPSAFEGLNKLRALDLSSNGILELPSNVFRPLKNLEHLDLSMNHLQVIPGTLTSGLHNLDTLKLSSNDIIRLEPLKDVSDHLSTLLLESNPLDCSCQLRSFQNWLQTEPVHLSLSSKRTIRCSTPTIHANAMLFKLDSLSCDDQASSEDIIPLPLSIPEEFSLLSKTLKNDELSLKWIVKIQNFTSDQVQLYKEDENMDGKAQFYSAPLIKSSVDLDNNTILEANFDLKKVGILAHNVHPLAAILACATIIKDLSVSVTNCTTVELEDQMAKHPKATIDSIKLSSAAEGQVEIDYRVMPMYNSSLDHCQIHLQLEAGDADDLGERVVASHVLRCKPIGLFAFRGLRLAPREKLRACSWLDFGPHVYQTHSVCSNVIFVSDQKAASSLLQQQKGPQHHQRPILPLVLTLVFLAVGIATLVVLYLIVKGYLSDRHKAELFRMRFCSLHQENNNRDDVGLFTAWTHRFYVWKRRHHRPVPDSDELMLREDSTFDTSVV